MGFEFQHVTPINASFLKMAIKAFILAIHSTFFLWLKIDVRRNQLWGSYIHELALLSPYIGKSLLVEFPFVSIKDRILVPRKSDLKNQKKWKTHKACWKAFVSMLLIWKASQHHWHKGEWKTMCWVNIVNACRSHPSMSPVVWEKKYILVYQCTIVLPMNDCLPKVTNVQLS